MRSDRISFRLIPKLKKKVREISDMGGFKNLSRLLFAMTILIVQDHRRGQCFIASLPSWIRDLANADPKDQDYAVEHMLNWPTDFNEMLTLMKEIDRKKRT